MKPLYNAYIKRSRKETFCTDTTQVVTSPPQEYRDALRRILTTVSLALTLTLIAVVGIWVAWFSPTHIREYVVTIRGVTPTFSPSHNQVLLGIIIPAMLLTIAVLALARSRQR